MDMTLRFFIVLLLSPVLAFGASVSHKDFDSTNFVAAPGGVRLNANLQVESYTANGPLGPYGEGATSPGFYSTTNFLQGMVNARSFGVLGDGTDESVKAQQAVDSFGKHAGVLFFPPTTNFYNFHVVITNAITILGPNSIKDFNINNLTKGYFRSPDTNFVFQVGDGTNLVKGVWIENCTLYSTNTVGTHGLAFTTSFESGTRNCVIWGFWKNLYGKAGSDQPCSVIRHYNLTLQSVTTDNSRSIHLIMPANQISYTTGWEFYGIHGNAVSSGTSTYFAEFDGTVPLFVGGYMDLQGGLGHGILLSKRNAGALEPYIQSAGTTFDGGDTAQIIELDATTSGGYPFDRIRATPIASGKIRMKDGSEYTLPSFSASAPAFYNASILSGLRFVKSDAFEPTGHLFITSGANDDLTIGSTNTINIVGGTLNGVYIAPFLSVDGNLFLPNSYGIRGRTVAGADFPMLTALSSDSVQMFSPNSLVSIGTNGGTFGWSFQTAPSAFSQRMVLDNTTGLTVNGPIVAGANNKLKFYDNAFAGIIQYEGSVGVNFYNALHGINNFTVQPNGNVDFNYTVNAAFIHPNNATESTLLQVDGTKTIVSIANGTGALVNNGSGTFSYAGIPATVDVLVSGGTTNRLVYTGGVLVSNISNFYAP